MPGRTRLRLAAKRGDGRYFAHLQAALRARPGVREVRVNPRTAGVLILHPQVQLEPIHRWAAENQWFEMRASSPRPDPLPEGTSQDLAAVGRYLKQIGGIELRTLIFFIMLVLGLAQTARGQIMAPAVSLFWYALSMIEPPLAEQNNIR